MCAISGSKNLNTLKELVLLNSYRGSHSYSFSLYNITTGILAIEVKKLGTIDLTNHTIPPNNSGIVHVQAPTTEIRSDQSIHPAIITEKYQTWPTKALWHNGIIKAEVVKEKAAKYNTSWDTMQILKSVRKSFDVLNEFDGTFSCLYYDRDDLSLNLFRNEISPMFFDHELNISSTMFEGSKETTPNVVCKIDFNRNRLITKAKFKTVENPYYFGD
jgi:hypothetical protein